MVSSVEVTHAELDEFICALCAQPTRRRSRPSPRLERGPLVPVLPGKADLPGAYHPLLDLAQFVVPALATSPKGRLSCRSLAAGLDLVDAVKDIRTALARSGQARARGRRSLPGYALSAGRAERHWRDDKPAAIAALTDLGLSSRRLIAETMRSPKQVELRAKARGLKVPSEFIVSHSLRRLAGAASRTRTLRCPAGTRSCGLFAEALTAFQGGSMIRRLT